MPTYNFKNTKTGEEWEEFFTLSGKDLFLEQNPDIKQTPSTFSISASGAVGMWQFMPRSGRFYKLNRSWWNEDRHDPYQSTEAAIEYLKYLYTRFDNDILLTLAAYNAGPSLLDKRIKKNNKHKGKPSRKI